MLSNDFGVAPPSLRASISISLSPGTSLFFFSRKFRKKLALPQDHCERLVFTVACPLTMLPHFSAADSGLKVCVNPEYPVTTCGRDPVCGLRNQKILADSFSP